MTERPSLTVFLECAQYQTHGAKTPRAADMHRGRFLFHRDGGTLRWVGRVNGKRVAAGTDQIAVIRSTIELAKGYANAR